MRMTASASSASRGAQGAHELAVAEQRLRALRRRRPRTRRGTRAGCRPPPRMAAVSRGRPGRLDDDPVELLVERDLLVDAGVAERARPRAQFAASRASAAASMRVAARAAAWGSMQRADLVEVEHVGGVERARRRRRGAARSPRAPRARARAAPRGPACATCRSAPPAPRRAAARPAPATPSRIAVAARRGRGRRSSAAILHTKLPCPALSSGCGRDLCSHASTTIASIGPSSRSSLRELGVSSRRRCSRALPGAVPLALARARSGSTAGRRRPPDPRRSPSSGTPRCSLHRRSRVARASAWSQSCDVDLGVVEERVGVEVRRADRQPAVVDDADLGVDVEPVDRRAGHRVDRRGQEAPATARRHRRAGRASRACPPRRCWPWRAAATTTRKRSLGGSRSFSHDHVDDLRQPEELRLEVDELARRRAARACSPRGCRRRRRAAGRRRARARCAAAGSSCRRRARGRAPAGSSLPGHLGPAQVEVLGDVGDDRAAQPGAGVVPAEAPARGMLRACPSGRRRGR